MPQHKQRKSFQLLKTQTVTQIFVCLFGGLYLRLLKNTRSVFDTSFQKSGTRFFLPCLKKV
eukprot:UN10615